MKNKNYKFGNSNYRKQKNEMWFHLEPGKNDSFLLFVIHPDDIQKCFDVKKLKEQTGTKAKLTYVCVLKYLGQPLVKSVKEFFENASSECRNIDDFFEVTMYDDKDHLGKPLPEDCRLFTLVC